MNMDNIISYLKTIDTPTICNAIELLDIRPATENFTSNKIKCLFPDLGPMVGYAVTVQMETVTQMEPRDPRKTMAFYEAIESCRKPVVIVIQEIGGMKEFAAHSGEVTSLISQHFGAIGLVTDCNIRDFQEVKALGFHTFAAGLSPSHVHCRIAQVGIPVHIHGMIVQQGDIIHGDVNGLVQIPLERIEELPSKIEEVRNLEQNLMKQVTAGDFTMDALRAFILGDV
jgi:regulator of RNase E activity RraA